MNRQIFGVTCFGVMLSLAICVQADDSLYIDPTGNVGIGTSIPTRQLQVESPDSAAIWVRNTSATAAERVPFTLSNNGKTRFLITNGANAWTFDNAGNRFQINKAGSGEPVEFEVYDNGDGHFGGDVYATEFLLTSSRERKTDFAPVNGREVLEQLARLDVQSWRYKEDGESERHIGPVAEEFREVFQVGDGTHISAVDTSGIAFAAIKGLYDETQQNAAEMQALKAENEALKQRLQNLEALMLGKELMSAR